MNLAGLMRAGAEHVLGPVAVSAEGLEFGRIPMPPKPFVGPALADLLPMIPPIVIDMVDGQEDRLRLSTASTDRSVHPEDPGPEQQPAPMADLAILDAVSGLGAEHIAGFAPGLPVRSLSEKLVKWFDEAARPAPPLSGSHRQLVVRAARTDLVAPLSPDRLGGNAGAAISHATVFLDAHDRQRPEISASGTPGLAWLSGGSFATRHGGVSLHDYNTEVKGVVRVDG